MWQVEKMNCVLAPATTSNTLPKMTTSAAITLVYIGATWCGPCRTVKPRIEELCKKFSISYKLRDYDADLSEEEKETVAKVPTIQIYQGGVLVAEYTSNQVAQTEAWFQTHISLGSALCEDVDF